MRIPPEIIDRYVESYWIRISDIMPQSSMGKLTAVAGGSDTSQLARLMSIEKNPFANCTPRQAKILLLAATGVAVSPPASKFSDTPTENRKRALTHKEMAKFSGVSQSTFARELKVAREKVAEAVFEN